MTINLDAADEDLRFEKDLENRRELIEEARAEEYYAWKNDNLSDLQKEYCDIDGDNFESFCKEAYQDVKG